MKSRHHILSFLVLCIYALFLFHDFIPHSHPENHEGIKTTEIGNHSHDRDSHSHTHSHFHDHSHESDKEDKEQKNHSENSTHHHYLTYVNHENIDEGFKLLHFQPFLLNDQLLLKELFTSGEKSFAFDFHSYADPPLPPHISLRAPPALG